MTDEMQTGTLGNSRLISQLSRTKNGEAVYLGKIGRVFLRSSKTSVLGLFQQPSAVVVAAASSISSFPPSKWEESPNGKNHSVGCTESKRRIAATGCFSNDHGVYQVLSFGIDPTHCSVLSQGVKDGCRKFVDAKWPRGSIDAQRLQEQIGGRQKLLP